MTSRTATRRRRALECPTLNLPGRVPADVDQMAAVAALTREAEEVGRQLGELLDSPEAEGQGLVGWGRIQRQVQRAEAPPGLEATLPPVPRSCFENSALYVLRYHGERPGMLLVHAVVWEEGMPLPHSFVAVNDAVCWDPTAALYLDLDDYLAKLQITALCVHEAAGAAARTHSTGPPPWPECEAAFTAAHERIMDALEVAHPELVTWVDRMVAVDERFRGMVSGMAGRDAWGACHLLLLLAQHPQRWRDHQPGSRAWPYTLRPAE